MTNDILSNSSPAVNRESLLGLNILLKKNAALAQLLFECKIIDFEEENPVCQYIWTLVDNAIVADECLDAVLSDVIVVNGDFAQGAHQRLEHMLQVAQKMRKLMKQDSFTSKINGLKKEMMLQEGAR